MRSSVLLLACSLLLVPLTGCASEDEGGQAEPYQVLWDMQPRDGEEGEAIEMTWSVEGSEGEIPHTGVHWADRSVSSPQSPADYGNTSGAREPAQIPGSFDTEITFNESGTYYVRAHAIVGEGEHRWSNQIEIQIQSSDGDAVGVEVTMRNHDGQGTSQENFTFEWQLAGTPDEVHRTGLMWGANSSQDPSPSAYPNETGTVQGASVPGTYNATLSDLEPGVYHARAYALKDGTHHWSDEVEFNVTEARDGSGAENHTVVIENFMYEPSELTVQPGDTITWENRDATTHTVTFANETFADSGDIESGETYTWTVPENVEPGTYDYSCDYHATMQASITVEEG